MTRHRIDLSATFSGISYEGLPESRPIEDPEAVPVEKNWPVRAVPREPYRAAAPLAGAVDLAIALGRPLLLQGDPGCGKTRLANAVAYALGLPLEECHIKSTTRAQDLLYSYDAVRRLYDAQLGGKGPRDKKQVLRYQDPGNYVSYGPLGRAIVRATYGRRSVVLLDEIDKADLDFPNDLLLELDRLEFRVPEVPKAHFRVPPDRPELRPIVFVTHNEEKALPAAFLRRCVYHYVEFPADEEELRRIVALHHVVEDPLDRRAIDVVLRLRDLDLSKKPGLSELLDWVGYLGAVKAPPETLEELPSPGVLLKHQADERLARAALARKG
jgi:MoxR-like ATPase